MGKKLSAKGLDRMISEAYYRRCSGIQINVLDIGRVFEEGRRAYLAGEDYEQAIADYVETIRKN